MSHPVFRPGELPALRLRPIRLDDAEAWYAWLHRPEVVEHTSWQLRHADDLRALIAGQYLADTPEHPLRYAIATEDGDTLIGTVGLNGISTTHRHAELAYDLSPAWWGRGVATHACRAVARWAFDTLRLVRLQAVVLDTNERSAKVLTRCGFVREGRLRDYRIVRGRPRDFDMWALRAREREAP